MLKYVNKIKDLEDSKDKPVTKTMFEQWLVAIFEISFGMQYRRS